VNLAARMESGAKSWGVYSMCTEATRLACEQHGSGRLVFRSLGLIDYNSSGMIINSSLVKVVLHD